MATLLPTGSPVSNSNGTPNQQAAAWELVTASILLGILVFVRFVIESGIEFGKYMPSHSFPRQLTFIKQAFTGEGWPHFILYVIIFSLVVSATVLQWF